MKKIKIKKKIEEAGTEKRPKKGGFIKDKIDKVKDYYKQNIAPTEKMFPYELEPDDGPVDKHSGRFGSSPAVEDFMAKGGPAKLAPPMTNQPDFDEQRPSMKRRANPAVDPIKGRTTATIDGEEVDIEIYEDLIRIAERHFKTDK